MNKTYIIDPGEEQQLEKFIDLIKHHSESYLQTIKIELADMIYEHKYILEPYRFFEILCDELKYFLEFLETKEITVCSARGEQVAKEGVGLRVLFRLLNTFQKLFYKSNKKDNGISDLFIIKITNLYMENYLFSYYQERRKQIHTEQEQVYEALITSNKKQQEEIAEKERQLQNARMKALEEKEQAKTNFLINLSHEIKLPLTILRNSVNYAKEEAGNRKLRGLDKVETEIINLTSMVINMLDYEKITQGKMLYTHEDVVNISHIIKAKVELFRNIIEQNNIELTTDIQDDLYTQIDSRAVDRVLNNIIDNAVKYNKDNGTIHIELAAMENKIRLQVLDTGTGISADQLPHIFKPYYQSESPKKNIQGIGAGLSIVKNILNEVHASISIESTENVETIVTITFRKKEVTDSDNIKEFPSLTKPVNRRNIKLKPEVFREGKKIIFFVEDNIELVKFLENELLPEYNFFSSFNGKDAMQKLDTIPKPDLIISDIMMDVMDGYTFFKMLKESMEFRDIPLIFLSAKASIADQTNGLELGAVDYITKPFNMEILKAKIDALIRDHDIYTQHELENFESRVLSALRSPKKNKEFMHKKIAQYNISHREKDVLLHVLNGLTNQEIADTLFIGIDTVKKHIQHIKEKCGVNRKIQLLNIFKT